MSSLPALSEGKSWSRGIGSSTTWILRLPLFSFLFRTSSKSIKYSVRTTHGAFPCSMK